MKHLFLTIVALATALSLSAQPGYTPSPENLATRQEFSGEKFGIFLHWGIYSMLGEGEWVLQTHGLKQDEYSRLAAGFYPSKYDAAQWARAFKESGARYVTITTRHHDGFSMFHTDQSEYNIVDATPFGRDVIKELADALAAEGLNLHFYYSHVDWGRDDYWPRGRTGLQTGRPDGKDGDWEHYKAFMEAQLTELLTNYGPVKCIWFDGVWDRDGFTRDEQPALWGFYEQYELIHRLQSGCMVGNNHHLVPFEGEDMQIFERDVPGENKAGYSADNGVSEHLPLETCQTMNENWGYDIHDKNYKSLDELITLLVRTAGKGANLLLNIGPRPDGTLPEEALERLSGMGKWLDANGESIYDTTAGIVASGEWGVSTMNGKILYLHLLGEENDIAVPVKAKMVKKVTALASGEAVKFTKTSEGIVVNCEGVCQEGPDRIIRIELK